MNHEPPNLPSEVMFVFICLICPAGGLMLENRNYRAEWFPYDAFYTFWWLPLEKQVTIIGFFLFVFLNNRFIACFLNNC